MAWIETGDGSDAGASSRVQMASVADERDLGAISGLIRGVIESGEADLFSNVANPSADPIEAREGTRDEPGASVGPDPIRHGFGFEPRTALAVPLCARGRILGAIVLALRDDRRVYGPEDLTLAADLAGRAAIAIDNARLYRDVQENDRRKNEFLAMLAHELRNPLAPIRNAVEILRMLNTSDAKLEWANDVISRQVEHLVRLVDDLLDISRITGGKIQLRLEPVDVSVAVARAVETSRPLIDARRHELTVTLPPQPECVKADLVRLAQVLANLLNNAAKYTEDGGRIVLDVVRVGDEIVFRVRDNGIGIAPEMIGSVFDLFTQIDRSIDRSQGGLGVGLTLVRELVEMHGGSVEAHSGGANRGSEFVVRLPGLSESPAPATGDSRENRAAPRPAPRRILMVDDYSANA